eukprot:3175939-Prymnesium_polylepis.1
MKAKGRIPVCTKSLPGSLRPHHPIVVHCSPHGKHARCGGAPDHECRSHEEPACWTLAPRDIRPGRLGSSMDIAE